MTTEDKRREIALRPSTYLPMPFDGPEAFYNIGVGPLKKSEWKHWKERYPSMSLSGCEPNPVLYKQLLQKFPGRLLQTAISDKPKIKLHLEPENEKAFGRSSVFPVKGLSEKSLTVPAMTLDEFDKESGQPQSIMLWMDIEGSELVALKSGQNLLASGRVVCINLEVRDNPGFSDWPTATQLEEFLKGVGFIKVLDYNNQKTHRDAVFIPVARFEKK